jgi:glucose-6-phosphate isomerase
MVETAYGERRVRTQRDFPRLVGFTTDLHSMGQYIQDGLRVIFETVLRIAQPRQDLICGRPGRP